MKHLSTEQLSAHLDHALTGRAAEEVARHLEGCDACREALAALAAQDDALRPALSHDPGEAYFENFSGRVEQRIRAAGLSGAQARERGFDLGRFFRSPRSLAWVGAVAVVVVGAGLALMTSREARPPDLRDRDLAERTQQTAPVGGGATGELKRDQGEAAPPTAALEQASPESPTDVAAREQEGAGQAKEGASSSRQETARLVEPAADEERRARERDDRAAKSPSVANTDRRNASPATPPESGRAKPGNGLDAQRDEAGAGDFAIGGADATTPRSAAAKAKQVTDQLGQVRKKLAAGALKDAPARGAMSSLDKSGAKTESGSRTSAFASPPPASPSQPLEGSTTKTTTTTPTTTLLGAPDGVAAADGRLCGEVRDPAGRPLAGAQVTVADIGRTTTTDSHGAFCLSAPIGEHPLTVMAVGFHDSRQTVRVGGEVAAVRVTLDAVSVMDDKASAIRARLATPPPAEKPAEPRDGYSALPDTLRSVVRAAQQLENGAKSRRSASLFDAAANGWEKALKRLPEGPLATDARWHLAEARYHAWEAGPNSRRGSAAVEALTAFIVRAQAGAERDQATRWLDQVRH